MWFVVCMHALDSSIRCTCTPSFPIFLWPDVALIPFPHVNEFHNLCGVNCICAFRLDSIANLR